MQENYLRGKSEPAPAGNLRKTGKYIVFLGPLQYQYTRMKPNMRTKLNVSVIGGVLLILISKLI